MHLLLAFLLSTTLAAAPSDAATSDPALPELPAVAGPDRDGAAAVDRDLTAALELAQARLAAGDLTTAIQTVLQLQLGDDRFSKAQRPLLAERSKLLLRQAGRTASGQGRLEEAAVALDAAWILGGKTEDAETSRALFAVSEKAADKGEALWLARRAVAADPHNAAAADADCRLSSNRYGTVGQLLLGAAAAGLVGGLVSALVGKAATDELLGSPHSHEEANALMARHTAGYFGAFAGFGLAIGGSLGGSALLVLGRPDYLPRSPAALPALPEER